MTAEEMGLVSATVVAVTQLIKWAIGRDGWGPIIVLFLSALGVGLWGYSEGTYERTQLFQYFAAWAVVATSAAGVYGFVRSTPETLTKMTNASLLVIGIGLTYMRVAASILLIVFVAACASTGPKAKVVAAYQSAELALGSFQDAEIAAYNAKTFPGLNEERHKNIHVVLERAFIVQDKLGSALLVWKAGQPVPTEVNEWFKEIVRVIDEVKALEPQTGKIADLARHVVEWARAAVELARELRVTAPQQIAAFAGVNQ